MFLSSDVRDAAPMWLRRCSFALAFLVGFSASAFAGGPRIAPMYSLEQARKIALARVPGTIVHEKLKHKKKKNPIYSIKIQPRDTRPPAMLVKVEVDGATGLIVKVKPVKPRQPLPKAPPPKDDDDDDDD